MFRWIKKEVEFSLGTNFQDLIYPEIAYNYFEKERNKYKNVSSEESLLLSNNTNEVQNWLKFKIKLSTIELYKKNQFKFPMDLALTYHTITSGINTANYNRIDLDFRLYF